MPTGKLFRKEEVEGKVVIDSSGRSFGKAKDVAFGLDGMVALIVLKNDNSEVEVPLDHVTGVADYILIREGSEPRPAPPSAAAPGAIPPPPAYQPAPPAAVGSFCKGCGAPLKPGAKFCTKCGTPA